MAIYKDFRTVSRYPELQVNLTIATEVKLTSMVLFTKAIGGTHLRGIYVPFTIGGIHLRGIYVPFTIGGIHLRGIYVPFTIGGIHLRGIYVPFTIGGIHLRGIYVSIYYRRNSSPWYLCSGGTHLHGIYYSYRRNLFLWNFMLPLIDTCLALGFSN